MSEFREYCCFSDVKGKEMNFWKNIFHKKFHYDIGCVGIWHNSNYGSVLTNFAMYNVFADAGCRVLMIAHPLKSEQKPYVAKIFHKIPYPQDSISKKYEDRRQMRELNKICNIFSVTSDQLFNGNSYRWFDKFMLLDYIRDNRKKMAYAASFGHDVFVCGDEPMRKEFARHMQTFNLFYVREQTGVALARNTFGTTAEWVLDPVFLAHMKHFLDMSGIGKAEGGGIAAYILDDHEEREGIVSDAARSLGLDSFIFHDFRDEMEAGKRNIPTVEDFLATFRDSEFVITDSFHGVCFAIIFKKQFIAIANKKRGLTRFESILGCAGLMDRLIFDFADYERKKDVLLKEKIDFDEITENMRPMMEKSKAAIQKIVAFST